MTTAPPESIAPAEARKRLISAARRVNRSATFGFVSSLSACLLGLFSVVYAVVLGLWSDLILVGFFTLAAAYNMTRFRPRPPPEPASWLVPSTQDERRLQDWVAEQCDGWRPCVRLTPHAETAFESGRLLLGLPLVACLRERELALLIRDVRDVHAPDGHRAMVRADKLLRGGIGRGLRKKGFWGKRPLSRRLVSRIQKRGGAMSDAHDTWARAVRATREDGDEWRLATSAAATVAEAWQLVWGWLEPALHLGVWHRDACTGLREFLDTAEARDVDVWVQDRLPGRDATQVLPVVESYEAAAMRALAETLPLEDVPITWSDHPRAVDLRILRSRLAAGLNATRTATGETPPATISAILSLLESEWGPTIAAVLNPAAAHAEEYDFGDELGDRLPPGQNDGAQAAQNSVGAVERALHDTQMLWLEAALTVALVDAGLATPVWTWPGGTVFVTNRDARPLDLTAPLGEVLPIGTDDPHRFDALRGWLAHSGLDMSAPLWLDGSGETWPERSVYCYASYLGLSMRYVVLSDRALRVYPATTFAAARTRSRWALTRDKKVLVDLMRAVDNGLAGTPEVEVRYADVVRATFGPGLLWGTSALTIWTAERRTIVHGGGAIWATLNYLEEFLGERIVARLFRAPLPVRLARGLFEVVTLVGFWFLLFCAFYALIAPAKDASRVVSALILAGMALGALAIQVMPSLAAIGLRALRRPRLRE